MYSIPKEIQSGIKIWKGVYVADGIFILCFGAVMIGLGNNLVHSQFRWLYHMYWFILMLGFIVPVKENAGIKKWQSYLFWLVRSRGFYNALIETSDMGVRIDEQE